MKSQRQAMDWSLVLASQGIEAEIENEAETGSWALRVDGQHFEKAVRNLRLYCKENRGWPWRQPIARSGVLFDWGALAWVAIVSVFYWTDQAFGLKNAGLMSVAEVSRGAWERLFTAVWLHADLGHLGMNLCTGFVLLGLAMGRHGTGVGLLAAYVAGVDGNLAGLMFGGADHRSLGASGMVMGCLGLIAVPPFRLWPSMPNKARFAFTGVAAGVFLFVLLGLNPQTDVLAHAGGFISGALFASLLGIAKELPRATKTQVVAGACFCVLVLIPWWEAISRLRPR